jgi:hypothetical protein
MEQSFSSKETESYADFMAIRDLFKIGYTIVEIAQSMHKTVDEIRVIVLKYKAENEQKNG